MVGWVAGWLGYLKAMQNSTQETKFDVEVGIELDNKENTPAG